LVAGHGVDQDHPVAVLQELPGLDGGEGGMLLQLHQLVVVQPGRGRHRPPVRRALFEWFVQSKGEGGCLKGGACADCNPSVRALLVLCCGVQRARDLSGEPVYSELGHVVVEPLAGLQNKLADHVLG